MSVYEHASLVFLARHPFVVLAFCPVHFLQDIIYGNNHVHNADPPPNIVGNIRACQRTLTICVYQICAAPSCSEQNSPWQQAFLIFFLIEKAAAHHPSGRGASSCSSWSRPPVQIASEEHKHSFCPLTIMLVSFPGGSFQARNIGSDLWF